MSEVVFRSKIDRWLAAIIVLSVVTSAAALVTVATVGSFGLAALFLPLLAPILVLSIWVLRRTFYVLDDSWLHVRSGPFAWRIPLEEIRAIAPTRNPLSSPALSIDRLRITYRTRSIMISPADRAGFLRELRGRAPAVLLTGDLSTTSE